MCGINMWLIGMCQVLAKSNWLAVPQYSVCLCIVIVGCSLPEDGHTAVSIGSGYVRLLCRAAGWLCCKLYDAKSAKMFPLIIAAYLKLDTQLYLLGLDMSDFGTEQLADRAINFMMLSLLKYSIDYCRLSEDGHAAVCLGSVRNWPWCAWLWRWVAGRCLRYNAGSAAGQA